MKKKHISQIVSVGVVAALLYFVNKYLKNQSTDESLAEQPTAEPIIVEKIVVVEKEVDEVPTIVKPVKYLDVYPNREYITKAGVNLRTTKRPYNVVGETEKGDVYKVHKIMKGFVINEKTYTVVFANRVRFGILNPFEYYMFIIDAFVAPNN
jgi:hypothetical protein